MRCVFRSFHFKVRIDGSDYVYRYVTAQLISVNRRLWEFRYLTSYLALIIIYEYSFFRIASGHLGRRGKNVFFPILEVAGTVRQKLYIFKQ